MNPSRQAVLGDLAGSMNRSVFGAATTFAQIVSEQVGMSVSRVELADRAVIDGCLSGLDRCNGGLCSVVQNMRTASGSHADALLVLPERGGLALVRRMLGLPCEPEPTASLTELEQDGLAEIGNIVIDACTGALSGAFGWGKADTPSRVSLCSADQPFGGATTLQQALVTHLCMHLPGLRIDGLVVLEMSGTEGFPVLGPQHLNA
jgi:chemotaxis protein CheC